MTDLPKPDYARKMRIVGHTDQGGRPDGVQVMVHRGFALDAKGLIYATDYNAGLYILEFNP